MANVSDRKRAALDTVMRDAVYEAAVKILTEAGLDGLTMERVASAAGVAKGTLYNYFEGKDALLRHVVIQTAEPILERMGQAADSDEAPPEQLRMIGHILCEILETHGDLFRMLDEARVINIRCPVLDSKRAVLEPKQRALAIMADVIQRGVDTGCFRPVPADLAAEFFHATLVTFGAPNQGTGVNLSLDEKVTHAMGFCLMGLGVSSPPPAGLPPE